MANRSDPQTNATEELEYDGDKSKDTAEIDALGEFLPVVLSFYLSVYLMSVCSYKTDMLQL